MNKEKRKLLVQLWATGFEHEQCLGIIFEEGFFSTSAEIDRIFAEEDAAYFMYCKKHPPQNIDTSDFYSLTT